MIQIALLFCLLSMLGTNGATIICCAFDFYRGVFQRRFGKAHLHIALWTHGRFSHLLVGLSSCFRVFLRAFVHVTTRAAVIGFAIDFYSSRMCFVLLRGQRHLAMWACGHRAFLRRFRSGFVRLLGRGQSRTGQHAEHGG